MELPTLTDEQCRRIVCIGESYQRLTGRPLVTAEGDPVQTLWSAPYAIVAHSTEAEPIFYFGNRKALELFEMDFDAFTHLPSRLSAEPLLREERAHLLEREMELSRTTPECACPRPASAFEFRMHLCGT